MSVVVDNDKLEQELHEKGFDIFVPFRPEWYNAALNDDQGGSLNNLSRLPTTNVASCFLVGNTVRLWPVFVDWCRRTQNEKGRLPRHPIDAYSQESIESTVEKHVVSRPNGDDGGSDDDVADPTVSREATTRYYWSSDHDVERLVDAQVVASVSGFAYHDSNNARLTVHPKYGAWTAYRAVVMVTVTAIISDSSVSSLGNDATIIAPPPPPPPPRIPNPLSPSEEAEAKAAVERALSSCDATELRRRLVENETNEEADDWPNAEEWIAVRDVVRLGKQQYRYGRNQLMYHYTKNKRFLHAAMMEETQSFAADQKIIKLI